MFQLRTSHAVKNWGRDYWKSRKLQQRRGTFFIAINQHCCWHRRKERQIFITSIVDPWAKKLVASIQLQASNQSCLLNWKEKAWNQDRYTLHFDTYKAPRQAETKGKKEHTLFSVPRWRSRELQACSTNFTGYDVRLYINPTSPRATHSIHDLLMIKV